MRRPGTKTFLGTPCKYCGGAERYLANSNCVPCTHKWNKTKRRTSLGWWPGEAERAERQRAHITHCEICGSKDYHNDRGWFADHDRIRGRFRGFLCHPCNIRLGFAERFGIPLSDDEAAYIKRHGGIVVGGPASAS